MRLAGREREPITIASYPTEQAVIDGGFREFSLDPKKAWEPVPGTTDEYRSTKAYPNGAP